MAISPQEVDEHDQKLFQQQIEVLELEIDGLLRNGDRNYPSSEIDNKVKRILIERYEKAGWIVNEKRYQGGVASGYYLQFEKHHGELMS